MAKLDVLQEGQDLVGRTAEAPALVNPLVSQSEQVKAEQDNSLAGQIEKADGDGVVGTWNWFSKGSRTAVQSDAFGSAFLFNYAKQRHTENQLGNQEDPAFRSKVTREWVAKQTPEWVPFSERVLLEDAPNETVFRSRLNYLIERNAAKRQFELSPVAQGISTYGTVAEIASTLPVGVAAAAPLRSASFGARFAAAGAGNVAAGAVIDVGNAGYGRLNPYDVALNGVINFTLGGVGDAINQAEMMRVGSIVRSANKKVLGAFGKTVDDVPSVVRFEEVAKAVPTEPQAAKAAEAVETLVPSESKMALRESLKGSIEPMPLKLSDEAGVMDEAARTVREVVEDARSRLRGLDLNGAAKLEAEEIEATTEALLGLRNMPDGWLSKGDALTATRRALAGKLADTVEDLKATQPQEAARYEALVKSYQDVSTGERVIETEAPQVDGHDAEGVSFGDAFTGITPVVSRKGGTYKLDFENPVDKALYLVGQEAKTSIDETLMGELRSMFPGQSDEAIRQAGRTLHEAGVEGVLDELGTSKALPGETPTVKVPTLQKYIEKKTASAIVKAAEAHISKTFGKSVKELLKNGSLKVVHDAREIPGIGKDVDPKAVAGVYMPHEGRGYLVASNLSPEDVDGVLLHEIGVHGGMKAYLGEEKFKQVLDDVMAKVTSGDEAFVAAKKMVDEAVAEGMTKAEDVAEEVLAYVVQEAPQHTFVQKLVSMVRRAVYQLTGGRLDYLTDGDYRAMALSALSGWSKVAGKPTVGVNPLYAIKVWHGTWTRDIKEFSTRFINTGEGAYADESVEIKALYSRAKRIAENEKNLVVMHNTRGESLKLYKALGGMPAPSIGVVKWDKPLEKFGDITLVGRKEMLNKADLYSGDAYTGRMPPVSYKVNEAAYRKAEYRVYETLKKYDLWSRLEGSLPDSLKGMVRTGNHDGLSHLVGALHAADELGIDVSAEVEAWKGARSFDQWKYTPAIVDKVAAQLPRGVLDLESFMSRQFEAARGELVYRDRKVAKDKPATASSVMKAMDPNRGVEIAGANALTTEKFKNVEALRQNQGQLGTDPAFKEVLEGVDQAFYGLQDAMKQAGATYFPHEYKLDQTLSQVAKAFDSSKDAASFVAKLGELLDEDLTKATPAVEKLHEAFKKARETPREYFEAKARRVVALNEWSHAIVPEGTDASVIKLLEDEGIEVHTYKATVKADAGDLFGTVEMMDPLSRVEVFKRIAKEETDILFSKVKNPQVDSPEFKKWFGESKVVDGQGKPLVMYRGTANQNAEAFDKDSLIFLSPHRKFADHYGKGGQVYELYVRSVKPFDASRGEGYKLWELFEKETNAPRWAAAGSERGLLPAWQHEQQLREWLDAKGIDYDGIWFAESNGTASLAVKDITQIKSAVGNSGAFDGTNPSILFSKVKEEIAKLDEEWNKGGYRKAGLLRPNAGSQEGAVWLPKSGKVAMTHIGFKLPVANKNVSVRVGWAPADLVGTSESNTARVVGDLLLVNSVGKVDESGKGFLGSNIGRGSELVPETADTLRDMWTKASMGQVQTVSNKAFAEWLTQRGIKPSIKTDFQMALAREFDRELADALRGVPGVSEVTRKAAADIQKVVAEFNQEMKALADRLQVTDEAASLLRKAADIDPSKTYMSRRWSREARLALGLEIGDEGILKIITESIVAKTPGMAVEEAQKAARKLLNTLDEVNDQYEMNLMGFLDDSTEATPRQLLERIELDEAMEPVEVKKLDGSTAKYTVRDLFENNVDRAVGSWFNTMAGIRALGHVSERVGVDLTSKKGFDALIAQARREGANDKTVKLMVAAREHIMGRVTDVWQSESELGSALRKTLTMRYGMYFAFAQLADWGNQIPRAQMNRLVASIPGIDQMKQSIKNGQPVEGLARDLANAIGSGYEHIAPVLKQSIEGGNAGAAYRNIGVALHKTMTANGFYAVMDLVRFMATNYQLYKLADFAQGTFQFKPEDWKHIKAFGLDEAGVNALVPLLRKHVKWDAQGVIESVDFKAMRAEDAAMTTKLEAYLYKVGQDSGSENAGLGQVLPFMTGEMGRTIFQFQNAAVVSHQRLRRDLLNFDKEVAMRWFMSYMLSAASYYARTVLVTRGLSEEEQQKKLDPHVVFVSAIRNTSSSGFVPNIISLASRFTPFDDPMSTATNSGRVSPNTPPVFDFFTSTQQSIKDMSSATFNEDDVLTRGEAQRASRSFNPLLAIQVPLQVMTGQLPEKNLPRPNDD